LARKRAAGPGSKIIDLTLRRPRREALEHGNLEQEAEAAPQALPLVTSTSSPAVSSSSPQVILPTLPAPSSSSTQVPPNSVTPAPSPRDAKREAEQIPPSSPEARRPRGSPENTTRVEAPTRDTQGYGPIRRSGQTTALGNEAARAACKTEYSCMVDEEGEQLALNIEIEVDTAKFGKDVCPYRSYADKVAYVVSEAKKKRAEVSWRRASPEERALFDTAKQKEIQCWLDHDVLEACLRQGVPLQRILRMRWVLSYKADGSAKARLVVLGFEDPDLTDLARDSPTLTRSGLRTLLAIFASRRFRLATSGQLS